ncbi:hypothetical protein A2870_02100 [Candidatus Curtissbacteria bacterium RIFCSPHIGHO2_01_FULL_41_11]|uniref:Right handed beta helix domain-containing protein n=1 Tax=Candidatus Curtissbacteria bacterium RIFCSPHIGHO2_01_FULL_41_11 TaxID=1797711 RepID=A0A1F5G428_9BACT|nr:MAG: hypothetical protein A2870_02100 [Candidatus Curtissbacteria bacterium RIFCSPHIGHO2_01_FULL_41_11]
MVIEIKPEDLLKISAQREEAMKNHILVSTPNSFVSAKITVGDRTVKARLRLRGILADHWRDPKKWSFKIHIEEDQALFGLTDFSIMHPQTRGYIDEWLFTRAMKREGQIAPNVSFVKVNVNGSNNGIYILEEDLSFRLIESNERIAGPILDFDQNLLVGEWARGQARGEGLTSSQIGRFLTMPTGIVNDNEVLLDNQQVAFAQKALTLLEAFRERTASTSDVFDVDKLAKSLALRALFASEALDPADIKFYYNPITSKVEIVGMELSSINRVGSWFVNQAEGRTKQFVELFFRDEEFVEKYIKSLEEVSETSYLDDLFERLNGDLDKNLKIIYSDFPDFVFLKNKYYQNQEYIREKLNPIKGVHAYLIETDGHSITVEIGNIQDLPVEILGITSEGPASFSAGPAKRLIIPPKKQGQLVDYKQYTFISPLGNFNGATNLNIKYSIDGLNKQREDPVFLWSRLDDSSIADLTRLKTNVEDFNFLATDIEKKAINVIPGKWKVDKNIIAPPGYVFNIGSGVNLDLLNSSVIFLQSPINITGTSSNPVVIESSDGTGQGLAVIGAKDVSTIKNAVFRNLTNANKLAWGLTGCITFYESPVNIVNTLFSEIKSEDALNIVRTSVNVDSTSFYDTSLDAIDMDFTDGKIENSTFKNLGEDAIDVSGGNVEIRKVVVEDAGDKGVSVGENSNLIANDLEINGAFIGLASKDLSVSKLENLKINKSKYGLAIYQKKAEFGPARIDVFNLISNNAEIPYIVEKQSKLSINQKEIKDKRDNVYSLLYPN